ncbi:hypothetical protein [Paenibacillus sp. PDC88]|uniref:Uncharacterized protein n=1 Tax=Paenibacillus provencensis TaxID=441151 RepID=A0ABW3Q230_9BACL|nr:hypothetical protein [Paenibacillus sp. PDC88]SDX62729.1 hypothetical protein SAMN05518848_11070 [Paenibacillus sp. PDC88]
MSKNKKVVLVSVGVLLLLIASVIFFRSPTKESQPEPSPSIVHTEESQESHGISSEEYSDSHDRVAKVIDDATNAIAERAPGWWDKIESWWDWFLGFKTHHAIILAIVALFIIGVVFNPKNRDQSRNR